MSLSKKLLRPVEPGGRAEYSVVTPEWLRWAWLGLVVDTGWIVAANRRKNWVGRGLGLLGLGFSLYSLGRGFLKARFGQFRQRQRLLDLAGGRATNPVKMLDLGTGDGLIAIGAAKRWPNLRVVAVDSWKANRPGSEEKLRSNLDLEELGGRIHAYQLEGAKLPFTDNEFSLVVSNLYLHSLVKEERQQVLIEAGRVLKPGGRLVLAGYGRRGRYLEWLNEAGLKAAPVGKKGFGAGWVIVADKAVL